MSRSGPKTKCQHCSGFGPNCDCSTPEGIVKRLEYKGLQFVIGTVEAFTGKRYLQVRERSVLNGKEVIGWTGRKWLLSSHMTRSEIVQTAFMACLAWEEHECREAFKYKGIAVFGPHFNVEALVKLGEQGNLDVRSTSRSES